MLVVVFATGKPPSGINVPLLYGPVDPVPPPCKFQTESRDVPETGDVTDAGGAL
jgi:hypothetical protein